MPDVTNSRVMPGPLFLVVFIGCRPTLAVATRRWPIVAVDSSLPQLFIGCIYMATAVPIGRNLSNYSMSKCSFVRCQPVYEEYTDRSSQKELVCLHWPFSPYACLKRSNKIEILVTSFH